VVKPHGVLHAQRLELNHLLLPLLPHKGPVLFTGFIEVFNCLNTYVHSLCKELVVLQLEAVLLDPRHLELVAEMFSFDRVQVLDLSDSAIDHAFDVSSVLLRVGNTLGQLVFGDLMVSLLNGEEVIGFFKFFLAEGV